jgi:hypothetical protein
MEQVPCDPQMRDTPSCALYRKIGRCFMDVHHLYYPRRDYTTPTEKRFRELEENKVHICRDLHDTEHAVFEIPEKPDVEIMQMAVTEERNRRRTA